MAVGLPLGKPSIQLNTVVISFQGAVDTSCDLELLPLELPLPFRTFRAVQQHGATSILPLTTTEAGNTREQDRQYTGNT